MSKVIRTANCKCGSVKFKIVSKSGEIDYVCAECNKYVNTIKCDQFESVKPICKKCGNDEFKVRIEVEDGQQYWSAYCTKCAEKPESIYVDENGSIISRQVRELLLIKDSVIKINNRVEELEDDLSDLKDRVDNSENGIESLGYEIGQLDKLSDKIYKLESDIRRVH